MNEERKWKDEEEKKSKGLIYSPYPFFALLYFSISSLVCVCGLCLSDPSSIQGLSQGKKPDASISLSFNRSVSLAFSRALPLLTFENKSLEFEFQSELASKRRVWKKQEEKRGLAGGGVGEGCSEPRSLRKGLLSASPGLPP